MDAIQNKYKFAEENSIAAMGLLNNRIDQAVLGEMYDNATSDVYNNDVGGSGATTAIPVGTSNIERIFLAAGRILSGLNVPANNRFAAVSPRVMETVRLYLAGRDTAQGDQVGNNGLVMSRFGFRIFESTNCPFTATWTPADNPSENATVTIAGVEFTFNASPSGAGSVDIGGTTAVSIDNLVAAVNDSGTAGTTYIQLDDDDRHKLQSHGIVATDETTAMTIVGYGDITVASSESADPWSAQVQHLVMGQIGACDLAVQKRPNVVIKDNDSRLGRNIYCWTMYGEKLFTRKKDAVVDVNIDASDWS